VSDPNRVRELVVVTNIPTPYRIPFFNSLHQELGELRAGLRVLYCAMREPNRHWNVALQEQRYPWEILPGWHPQIRQSYPHINPSIIGMLRRLRPSWLLLGGAWNTPTTILAGLRRLTYPAPRIFWSEGHANAVIHPGGPVAMVRRWSLRTYDAFAVPNEASARFIRDEVGGSAPVLHLPNTVDDEYFSRLRADRRHSARERLRLPADRDVLVCVAQLEDRKGTLELTDAFERLPTSLRSHVILSFIGDGALRSDMEARAARVQHGEIRILGHLERSDVGDWLAAADAFILPTKRDPNPLSVIEAAFARLPLIVSSKAGNSTDLVLDGETGYLIDRPEPTCIASALERFFANRTGWRNMGHRAFLAASAGFKRDAVARRFAEAIDAFPTRSPASHV
jgi:glycosyltransferase involved in cell wall biosynthesis